MNDQSQKESWRRVEHNWNHETDQPTNYAQLWIKVIIISSRGGEERHDQSHKQIENREGKQTRKSKAVTLWNASTTNHQDNILYLGHRSVVLHNGYQEEKHTSLKVNEWRLQSVLALILNLINGTRESNMESAFIKEPCQQDAQPENIRTSKNNIIPMSDIFHNTKISTAITTRFSDMMGK